MKKLLLTLSCLSIGCSTTMEAAPIFLNGSTVLLNEVPTITTFEISSLAMNLPLSIKLPDDFKSYKYATLIASKTKNTGGWIIKHELKGDTLNYCIKSPEPMSAVSMALSTPYLIVAHNTQFKISEDVSCI